MAFEIKDPPWEDEPDVLGVLQGTATPTSTTPIDAASLNDQEARIATAFDAVEAALAGSVRALRRSVRNEHRNPVLVTDLTGYSAENAAGAHTPTRVTTDAKFASGGASRCVQYSKAASDFSTHWYSRVWLGPSGGTAYPCMPSRPVFVRCYVKMTDAPQLARDKGFDLYVQFYGLDGTTTTTAALLDKVQIRTLDEWVEMSGWATADAAGYTYRPLVQQELAIPSGTADLTWRVSNPQFVTDPDGDVPVYGDGYQDGWEHMGTTGLSRSRGSARTLAVTHPDLLTGFNDLTIQGLQSGALSEAEGQADLDLMVEIGMNCQRTIPGTVLFQPTEGAPYEWDALDPYYEGMIARGMKLGLSMGGPPNWMVPSQSGDGLLGTPGHIYPPDAAYHDEFCALYEAIIERYGIENFSFLELWNEPNLDGFWSTNDGADAAGYVTLLAAVYAHFSALYPDLPIAAGSLSLYENTDTGGQDYKAWLDDFIAADGLDYCDALAWHPYSGLGFSGPLPVGGVSGWNAGMNPARYEIRKRLYAAGSGDLPMYATETGYGDYIERPAAQDLDLTLGTLARWPEQLSVAFHKLRDDDATGYGFVSKRGERKPKFRMIRRSLSQGPEALYDLEHDRHQWARFPGSPDEVALGTGWTPGGIILGGEHLHFWIEDDKLKISGCASRSPAMTAAAEVLFTLPANRGLRPRRTQFIGCWNGDNTYAKQLAILSTGEVYVYGVVSSALFVAVPDVEVPLD